MEGARRKEQTQYEKQNKKYFKDIIEQMENGGYEAFLYYLLNLDIKDFDHRTAPQTEALLEQKNLSLEPYTEWLYEKLCEGVLIEGNEGWEGQVKKTELQDDCMRIFQGMGIQRQFSPVGLGMRLSKLIPGLKKRHFGDGGYYFFPSLDECREQFEKSIGYKIEWPIDAEEINDLEKNKKPLDPF